MGFSFTSSWARKRRCVLPAFIAALASYSSGSLLCQPVWSGDGSISQSTSPTQPGFSGSPAEVSVKQFLHNLFQNTNASPQDVYVFPKEYGAVSSTDLPNFHQVEPYLYRGGAPSEAGMKVLQKMGIKTVVDLRKSSAKVETEGREARTLGMRYVNLPVARGIPETQYQEKFYDMVQDASKRINKGQIFVHCDFGCDRTGYMVGMWRIRHDHWSNHDAMQEMFKYGYLIHLAGPEEPRLRDWLTKMQQNSK
jgi:protein tyrosine phosphatase (PTP) superfamily phosphohydrolase (DUF442 family)